MSDIWLGCSCGTGKPALSQSCTQQACCTAYSSPSRQRQHIAGKEGGESHPTQTHASFNFFAGCCVTMRPGSQDTSIASACVHVLRPPALQGRRGGARPATTSGPARPAPAARIPSPPAAPVAEHTDSATLLPSQERCKGSSLRPRADAPCPLSTSGSGLQHLSAHICVLLPAAHLQQRIAAVHELGSRLDGPLCHALDLRAACDARSTSPQLLRPCSRRTALLQSMLSHSATSGSHHRLLSISSVVLDAEFDGTRPEGCDADAVSRTY